MHGAHIGGRSENNIKCVLHDDLAGGRTEQLVTSCRVAGFSVMLCFIVVEHFRFFHGALQLAQR